MFLNLHITKYYSAIKENKLIYTTTWINFKIIMLKDDQKRIQRELFHSYKTLKNANYFIVTENRSVFA